jgi:hypothetical protein
MIRVLAIVFALVATAALPQDASATDGAISTASPVERWEADPTTVFSASEVDLADFKWLARPVVVFADSPANPSFRQQISYLLDRPDALAARDVVIVTDTDPEGGSDLRRTLRPRGFMLALVGKDGAVEIRKPLPWDVRELTRAIDKMPLRQQEIREGR